MTREEKALLDTIAYCEGTLGVSNNGYDVIVGSKRIIAGWTEDTDIVHGGNSWYDSATKSTAAGRYQFLFGTWKGSSGINLPMTKVNQDKRGLDLINSALGNLDKSLLTNRFTFNQSLNKLAKVWASIPLTSDIIDNYPKPNTKHRAGYSYYDYDGINKTRKTPDKIFEIFNLALSKY